MSVHSYRLHVPTMTTSGEGYVITRCVGSFEGKTLVFMEWLN